MNTTAYNAAGQQVPVPERLPLGMVAHYFAGRSRRYVVFTPTAAMGGVPRIEIDVANMSAARKLAKGAHARPWNF